MKKTGKTILISAIIFGLLVGGIITIQILAPEELEAEVACTPWNISLEDMGPVQCVIRISLPNGNNHEDIDPESIRIEGFDVTKEDPDYPKIKKNYFKYLADGSQMMSWIILPRIWHMAPGPGEFVYLDLMLTGELYGGQPFQGTFTLRVITEANDNNNGVPPP